ncbi:glutamate racemase, partial [uncultured Campylobacter sp.]|uniref:glutamate racemase n=1 Tax=uncultured Campylobacter sp. TaxID=218934 RepID=UPI00345BCE84
DSFGSRPTLLIATPLTIAGEKLARLVGRLECETWSLPLPRLVEFAQDLEFDSPAVRTYLQGELAKFELERLGSLVLGCTHFNYFKDVLHEILPPHVRIIDGIDGTLNRLASELGGGLKLAHGEDLPSRATKFDADGGVKFNTNSSAQVSKFDAEGRDADGGQSVKGKSKQGAEGRGEGEQGKEGGDEQGAERCDESGGKIYYPNGNSVQYFYSGRALNAAQLRKVELFLKRLDAMRGIG